MAGSLRFKLAEGRAPAHEAWRRATHAGRKSVLRRRRRENGAGGVARVARLRERALSLLSPGDGRRLRYLAVPVLRRRLPAPEARSVDEARLRRFREVAAYLNGAGGSSPLLWLKARGVQQARALSPLAPALHLCGARFPAPAGVVQPDTLGRI